VQQYSSELYSKVGGGSEGVYASGSAGYREQFKMMVKGEGTTCEFSWLYNGNVKVFNKIHGVLCRCFQAS